MKSDPLLFFATTTGNAELAAELIQKELQRQDIPTTLKNIYAVPFEEFRQYRVVIASVSTWGDGEPPDEAIDFWAALNALPEGALAGAFHAVYALGDTAYDAFCAFGRELDEAFARLGSTKLVERMECDVDYDTDIDEWSGKLAAALKAHAVVV